jgi:integrase
MRWFLRLFSAALEMPAFMAGSRPAKQKSPVPYAGKSDWVFASNKLQGKRPISGCQFVKDYIRPRFVEHGLIDADYTGRAGLHAFRHSLATVLIVEEKVDPKTAQGILRHTDAGLTMNIYTHAQDPAKRAALERFESRLVQ